MGELLHEIVDITARAGDLIMPFFRRGTVVEYKDDDSPVTEADRTADDLICAALAELTPDIPVVSEEGVDAGRMPDIGGGRFWLVDPLDGTREFIAGRDEFTVNIALIEAGRPMLGAVGVPVQEAIYAGSGPDTATCRIAGGEARPIAARRPAPDGLVVAHSRSHARMEELEEFLSAYKVKDRVVSGSSVKLCLIAAGQADLYPRLGPTRAWDIAAGHAVLAAAGGHVRTMDGDELTYERADLLNPHFVATGLDP